MRLRIEAALDYNFAQACDVLLALEAAPLRDQRLVEDKLKVGGVGPLRPVAAEDGIGRRTWLRAEGPMQARYHAIVDVNRPAPKLDGLAFAALADLPPGVLPYLWPSRYCESDRFEAFVDRRFGAIQGGGRIHAMADWIRAEMSYVPGTSDTSTTAADAFVSRQGVCRDYAHLMASFARATGVPARLVSAYALDLDPPDFHAVVEVWLDGAWHIVDATGLAKPETIVRICVGRDATDIAFMTSFGFAEMNSQSVTVTAL